MEDKLNDIWVLFLIIPVIFLVYKNIKYKNNEGSRPCPKCGTKCKARHLWYKNGRKVWDHKCPNCGEEFSIDENYYNKIVKQIRDKEFAKEVKNV